MSGFTKSMAYPWALTGIFGAVHLVITLIPFNIGVGGGGEISFGLVSAPIVGFLLGPFFGVISVLIGSGIAIFINPGIALIGPFTVIATAAGAYAAGTMRTKLRVTIPIFFHMSMAAYLLSPIGLLLPQYLIFYFIIFPLSLVFLIPMISEKLMDSIKMGQNFNRILAFLSLWLVSIVAVAFDSIVGSAIGAYYFIVAYAMDPTALAGLFALGIPLVPIERLVASIIITLILVTLSEVLSRVDFGLPLSRIGNFELLELTEEEI